MAIVSEAVLSVLKKKIQVQMSVISDHISSGSSKDIEDYRKMCGMIEGLAWSEREIIDLESRLNDL
jgi:hypothetical protein|tara:strand:+ start:1106 stop:1303 length:198 start_codon:yes stop_codon:yes gene_type:complete